MLTSTPTLLAGRHLAWLCLLVAAAGQSAEAASAQDGVQCDVVVGWDSRVSRNGALVPVRVTLANRAVATDAVIELRQLDRLGRSDVVVRKHVVAPAPSEQTHRLLIRLDPDRELQVRVTFSESSLRPFDEKATVTTTGKRLALFVGVPDFLFRRTYRGAYLFVSTNEEDLPPDPLCYDGVHIVVISGDALAGLRPAQSDALRRWVVTGGRVAVLGATRSVRDSSAWRRFTKRADGAWGGTGVWPFGAGWLGIDPGDEFTSLFWEDDERAASLLVPTPSLGKDGFLGLTSPEGGVFASLAGRTVRRGREAISLLWVSLVLGGYLLTIGPLAALIARRFGRAWLRPAVFYAGVLVFGLAAGIYGALVHTEFMKVARVNILDGAVGAGTLRGRSLHWVYSPRHASYAFGLGARGTVASAADRWLGAVGRDQVTIRQDGGREIRARIPAYSTGLFDASWYSEFEWGAIQCKRSGTFPEISLPEGLPVQYVCLATRDHYVFYGRHYETTNWLPREQPRPWRRLTAPGALDPVCGGGRVSAEGRWYVPTLRGQLLEYALWVSFVHVAEDEVASGGSSPKPALPGQGMGTGTRGAWGGGYGLATPGYYGRSALEECLNIYELVASGGEVLIIFLSPECDMLKLDTEQEPPDATRIDVLRIKLPPVPGSWTQKRHHDAGVETNGSGG